MTYYNIDVYSRPIATASPQAQLWFNRGLVWVYAYNHEEAIVCFKRALEHDTDCVMAHWGIAYAAGPNYNLEWRHFDPDGKAAALAAAYAATRAALSLRNKASPPERALIDAMPARYPQRETIEAQEPWNDMFADAMREVYRQYPDDLDVATIFVEAILNRTPWRMWDLKTGGIAEGAGTVEAREVLERAMREDPAAMRHPGILHLYVHLMEMSPFPELALRAGDVLRTLVPDAGHLIHMPTHIDVQCGAYHDVVVDNQRGIAADRRYYDNMGALNFYSAYRVHNYHFAIYGAMFLGQYEPALAAADELIETTPEELLRLPSPPMADFIESYIPMKQHVYIRFGKWNEIIAQELPADRELYCVTVTSMHYAKGVAHAALGDVPAAEREQEFFLAARAKVPDSRLLHNNVCLDLFAIAEQMFDGEIEYRKGNYDAAFAHLRRAVELDDGLLYDEPWGWIQPTRHALGALLLEQGHVDEAEAIYREDLGLGGKLSRATIHPDNVWSLRGLHDCLTRKGGKSAELRLIKQRLDLAAARADLPVHVSCFCARSAAA
ncbi:MAG: hypothetical protein WD715_07995 [Dongiaceae bacterium]